MSQCSRIDAVLDVRPVTIADFDRQPACDGGNKIARLAARIDDLKKQGKDIRSRWVTLGDVQVKQYYKVFQSCPRVSPAGQAPAAEPSPLEHLRPATTSTQPRCALFDDDWEDAA